MVAAAVVAGVVAAAAAVAGAVAVAGLCYSSFGSSYSSYSSNPCTLHKLNIFCCLLPMLILLRTKYCDYNYRWYEYSSDNIYKRLLMLSTITCCHCC